MVFRYSSRSTGNDAAHSSLSAECILWKIGQPEEEAQDICVCSRKQLQTVPQITTTQVYSFSIYILTFYKAMPSFSAISAEMSETPIHMQNDFFFSREMSFYSHANTMMIYH